MDIQLIKMTHKVDNDIAEELDGLTPEQALDWWGLECVDYEKEEMR